MKVVELNQQNTGSATVAARLRELADLAEHDGAVAHAAVIVRRDGSTCTTSFGSNRIQLIGIMADLQYSLCKDGDR